MKKLILLSDLWGKEKPNWIFQYIAILEKHFDVKYYDCCELGGISKNELFEEYLHNQFVNGGIDTAVNQLLKNEKETYAVLGFSIGGTIAWKACLSGLKSEYLFAVSATRLRYETEKPLAKTVLFYGEKDTFIPDEKWFQQMEIKENIYLNEGHELYLKKEIAEDVCKRTIEYSNSPNR